MNFKRSLALSAVLLVLTLCFCTCFADEARVLIPVHCKGPAATAVLFDSDGNEIERKLIPEEQTENFVVKKTEPGNYTYTLKLVDENTSKITYDDAVYNVYLFMYIDDAGKLNGIVSTDVSGAVGIEGKPAYIEFQNKRKPEPAPPSSHSDTTAGGIRTGDVPVASFLVLAGVSSVLLVVLFVLKKKRSHQG